MTAQLVNASASYRLHLSNLREMCSALGIQDPMPLPPPQQTKTKKPQQKKNAIYTKFRQKKKTNIQI